MSCAVPAHRDRKGEGFEISFLPNADMLEYAVAGGVVTIEAKSFNGRLCAVPPATVRPPTTGVPKKSKPQGKKTTAGPRGRRPEETMDERMPGLLAHAAVRMLPQPRRYGACHACRAWVCARAAHGGAALRGDRGACAQRLMDGLPDDSNFEVLVIITEDTAKGTRRKPKQRSKVGQAEKAKRGKGTWARVFSSRFTPAMTDGQSTSTS